MSDVEEREWRDRYFDAADEIKRLREALRLAKSDLNNAVKEIDRELKK